MGILLIIIKSIKSFVQNVLQQPIKSALIIVLAIFYSQLSGFVFPGSHWDSFGNEDGLVWRGATEQNFFPFKNFGLRFGEEHVYGEKPWNKKLTFYVGPVIRIDFSKSAINSVLSFGLESRAVNANLFLTPYASYWFGWNFKKLVGSSWASVKNEDGNSLVGRVFLEQGIDAMNIGDAKLIPQIAFRGAYSLKPCPWDRNLEISLGPKLKIGLFDGFIHLVWNRNAGLGLKTQIAWWIGWDLQNFLRFRRKPESADLKQEEVYLTFDCGIGGEKIDECLNVLRRYNIKATFFVVGSELVRLPAIVPKILADGHTLGNHTWSHPYLSQLSKDSILKELRIVDSLVGYKLVNVRPPYSDINDFILSVLEEDGRIIRLFTIDPHDWEESTSPESVFARIKRQLRGEREVIIFHLAGASGSPSLDVLPAIIELCRRRGYNFRSF